jgi:hypothetical protein
MTFLPKIAQLALELPQLFNALVNVRNVLINDGIDGIAIIRRFVSELEQRFHLFLGHIQGTAIPDENELLQMVGAVNPIIILSTMSLRQEPLFFVIPDRLDGALSCIRQVAYSHCFHRFSLPLDPEAASGCSL